MQFHRFRFSLAMLCGMASLSAPLTLHAKVATKPARYFVRFVASSTAVHSAWALSQDVYLVELRRKPQDSPFLAKLVDEYPDYEGAIAKSILASDGTARLMKLARDSTCDVPYARMPKRTAPGDPRATDLVPMNYVPGSYAHVDPLLMLRCYRLVRR